MSVEVDSSDALQALKKLSSDIKKVETPALRAAAQHATVVLTRNTPVWSGKKSGGKRGSYMKEHAKDHVVVGNVKDGTIDVGYDKDVSWRMHFIEFGTIKQKPQAFVQKTQAQIEDEVTEIIAKEIRKRLGL